jgi:hypothetical protein
MSPRGVQALALQGDHDVIMNSSNDPTELSGAGEKKPTEPSQAATKITKKRIAKNRK